MDTDYYFVLYNFNILSHYYCSVFIETTRGRYNSNMFNQIFGSYNFIVIVVIPITYYY